MKSLIPGPLKHIPSPSCHVLSLLTGLGDGDSLILPHLALVALDSLFALPSTVSPDGGAFLALPLGLHVNLDDPVVLALLVHGLVAPLALPLAALLIVDEVLALLARLGLDALLGGKALPLGRGFGLGHRLLAGEAGAGLGQREEDAVGGGGEWAGGEELVDEGLGAVAGELGEGLFKRCVVQLDRVGVLGHEVAEIEGVGRRLLDCDGQLRF